MMASPDKAVAEPSPEAFVKWAATKAIPLTTLETEGDTSDLLPLKSVVGAVRVVAIGEPNHGTHEPLAFRNRMVRFLVEQMGFTAVALETGFTEAIAIEKFVAGGAGDLKTVVEESMSWGFGQFPENKELIQWMRQYNQNPAHSRKIRFYGIDLTGAQNGAFPQARRAVDFALSFLERSDAASAAKLRASLAPCLERFSTDQYSTMAPADREKLATGLLAISGALESKKTSLVALTSEREYSWARHSIAVARQLKQMFDLSPPPDQSGRGIPPEAYPAASARDSGMADNVRWALEREGTNGRLIVFAHNNHIMNAPLEGGVWNAFRKPPSTMGMALKPALGHDLLIMGGTSGAIGEGLPPEEAGLKTIDISMAKVGVPNFVIDLRAARSDHDASGWLDKTMPIRANMGTHVLLNPGQAFDALYFVNSLSPTHAAKP